MFAGEYAIKDIYFFSALPTHEDEDQKRRHRAYCKILQEHCKVKLINGTYKKKQEKKTDINIAVQVLKDVSANVVDKICLISNDTDFIPLIKAVIEMEKEVMLLHPPSIEYKTMNQLGETKVEQTSPISKDFDKELGSIFTPKKRYSKQIGVGDLMSSLLEEEITIKGILFKNPYSKHQKHCSCVYCNKNINID